MKYMVLFMAVLFSFGCASHKCNIKDDLALLSSSSEDKERIKAINNLKHCSSGPEINGPLLNAMEDNNPQVRRAAICSLIEINSNELPSKILEKLSKEDQSVRAEVINALADVTNGKSAQLLIYVMVFDPSDDIRSLAARSLGKCCAFNAGFITYFPTEYPYGYYDGIRDGAMYWPDPGVAVEVSGSPGKLQTTSSKALIYSLQKDKSGLVRESAAYALGFSGNKESVIPALIKALEEDSSYSVKAECAMALGHIGDDRVKPVLIKASQSENDLLRMKATEALSVLNRGAYN